MEQAPHLAFLDQLALPFKHVYFQKRLPFSKKVFFSSSLSFLDWHICSSPSPLWSISRKALFKASLYHFLWFSCYQIECKNFFFFFFTLVLISRTPIIDVKLKNKLKSTLKKFLSSHETYHLLLSSQGRAFSAPTCHYREIFVIFNMLHKFNGPREWGSKTRSNYIMH